MNDNALLELIALLTDILRVVGSGSVASVITVPLIQSVKFAYENIFGKKLHPQVAFCLSIGFSLLSATLIIWLLGLFKLDSLYNIVVCTFGIWLGSQAIYNQLPKE